MGRDSFNTSLLQMTRDLFETVAEYSSVFSSQHSFVVFLICLLYNQPGSLGYLPRCSAHRATPARPRWRIGK